MAALDAEKYLETMQAVPAADTPPVELARRTADDAAA
jgi:hypothetical protein